MGGSFDRGTPERHDAYAAMRVRPFRFYLIGNVLSQLGMQMQITAVGWDVYDRTGDTMALAWVGLVQVAPVVALTLPAGHLADRLPRKVIVMFMLAIVGVASALLAVNAQQRGQVTNIYALLALTGMAKAFLLPAKASFLPSLVPKDYFPNAITWATGGFHLASVLGPAAAGILIALSGSATIIYALDALFCALFVLFLTFVPLGVQQRSTEPATLATLLAGAKFLWQNPVMFGAITLDMFAVLFGGATALLPVFANDILMVGPEGLGWLRAAPAVGAIGMAWLLAHRPPIERAGRTLLWTVVGFGAATIVFGLSKSFWLSWAMLLLTGAFDNISVVIRHTLVQVLTPDAMRGRVSAINGMFISISNELGEAESGLVASLIGPVGCVVAGGIGTIAVVAASAVAFPTLRKYGRLGSGGGNDE